MRVKSALDLIGSTPLLSLERLHDGPARIFAKAEFLNPGGSLKDRAAMRIIRSAKERGVLVSGEPVVELTSGNMGAGLSVVCAVYGHPFAAVMSEGNSPERAKMMRGLGANVVLIPQVDGIPGRVTGADLEASRAAAVKLASDQRAFYVDQFNNPECVTAHETTTGPEIWEQLGGCIDAFLTAVGSGGSFVGIARYLKARNASIKCFCVEPEGAEVLAGKPIVKSQHLLQGTGYGFVPPLWNRSLMDGSIPVSDDEAEEYRLRLGRAEGLYTGYSAAANVCAANKLAESGLLPSGARIATLLCDTGLKY